MATNEEKPQTPSVPRDEIVGPEVLKPTVYYFVIIDEDKNLFPAKTKRPLYGEGGKTLLEVCPKTAAAVSIMECAALAWIPFILWQLT